MTRGPEIDGENRRQNCVQTDFRQLKQAGSDAAPCAEYDSVDGAGNSRKI